MFILALSSIPVASFLPTLYGKKQIDHEYINWEFQLSGWFQELPNGGFRQSTRFNDWKAVRYGLDSDIELYDLRNDVSETKNLANQYPEIISKVENIFRHSRTEAKGFPYGGVIQNHKSLDRIGKIK